MIVHQCLQWNLGMLQARHTPILIMVHFLTKVTPPLLNLLAMALNQVEWYQRGLGWPEITWWYMIHVLCGSGWVFLCVRSLNGGCAEWITATEVAGTCSEPFLSQHFLKWENFCGAGNEVSRLVFRSAYTLSVLEKNCQKWWWMVVCVHPHTCALAEYCACMALPVILSISIHGYPECNCFWSICN